MTNLIEKTERQQLKYWKGALIAWLLALALLVVRHLFGSVFKEYELNSRPIGFVVLTVNVIMLLAVMFFIVKLPQTYYLVMREQLFITISIPPFYLFTAYYFL